MGSFKIGNLGLSSAFIGSTEIQKIFVGNVKVYEKQSAPSGVTISYATNLEPAITSAHYNCTVSPSIPFTITGSTSLEVTPPIFWRIGEGVCAYFDYFHVGTANSFDSSDVVNYNFANHVNTFVTGHGTEVPIDNTHGNLYGTFVYNLARFNPETHGFFTVSLSRVSPSASTTFNLNTVIGDVLPTSGSASSLVGRRIVISGSFGSGTSLGKSEIEFEEEVLLSELTPVAQATVKIKTRISITMSLGYLGNNSSNRYNFVFSASSSSAAAGTVHVCIKSILIK